MHTTAVGAVPMLTSTIVTASGALHEVGDVLAANPEGLNVKFVPVASGT